MIILKYINKEAITIAAMQDYKVMKSLYTLTKNSFPQDCNHEERSLLKSLNLDYERYNIFVEYWAWFHPAWCELDEIEKKILTEFYMCGNMKSGANIRLQHEYNYSDRQIERYRKKALNHLTILLLGT